MSCLSQRSPSLRVGAFFFVPFGANIELTADVIATHVAKFDFFITPPDLP
jgi:hypothetical protein